MHEQNKIKSVSSKLSCRKITPLRGSRAALASLQSQRWKPSAVRPPFLSSLCSAANAITSLAAACAPSSVVSPCTSRMNLRSASSPTTPPPSVYAWNTSLTASDGSFDDARNRRRKQHTLYVVMAEIDDARGLLAGSRKLLLCFSA